MEKFSCMPVDTSCLILLHGRSEYNIAGGSSDRVQCFDQGHTGGEGGGQGAGVAGHGGLVDDVAHNAAP